MTRFASAHLIFDNNGTLLDLVGEMLDISLGEETGLTVEEEKEVGQDPEVTEKVEREAKEQNSNQEAPDSGLRRSRRLEQQQRQSYTEMAVGNSNTSKGETLPISSLSEASGNALCIVGIASESSTGPGALFCFQRHWRDPMACSRKERSKKEQHLKVRRR